MSVLAESAIRTEMKKDEDPLVVTPLLDDSQIGAASIDVRLGTEFIVWRRCSMSSINPLRQRSEWHGLLHRSQERMRVSLFETFTLHPGELVLGSTLEYLSIPGRLMASVEGRSSWGRLGLIIATATTISPRFKGCLTLEIMNSGEVPLEVYPGLRIAQLVIHRTEGSGAYRGRYNCPTGPEFTKAEEGWEGSVWCGSESTGHE